MVMEIPTCLKSRPSQAAGPIQFFASTRPAYSSKRRMLVFVMSSQIFCDSRLWASQIFRDSGLEASWNFLDCPGIPEIRYVYFLELSCPIPARPGNRQAQYLWFSLHQFLQNVGGGGSDHSHSQFMLVLPWDPEKLNDMVNTPASRREKP